MNIKKALVFLPLVIIALLVFLPGGVANASEIKMNCDSFSFNAENDTEVADFWAEDSNIQFIKAVSDNNSVAEVEISKDDKNLIHVYPVAIGSCNINLTDSNGDTATIKISVNKAHFLQRLMNSTELIDFYYGSKKAKIISLPGTSGVLKIGKEKIKFKVNSKGKAKIKIKGFYKLNKKYTFTVKNTALSGKPSFTRKWKLGSLTCFVSATSKGKKIKVKIYNPHKGDLVKIKFKGKSYSKKIKKDYHLKRTTVTFKVKKTVPKKKAAFSLKITNKFKQTLEKKKVTLYNGTSDYDENIDN